MLVQVDYSLSTSLASMLLTSDENSLEIRGVGVAWCHGMIYTVATFTLTAKEHGRVSSSAVRSSLLIADQPLSPACSPIQTYQETVPLVHSRGLTTTHFRLLFDV